MVRRNNTKILEESPGLKKILSLSREELEKIFAQLTMQEIEDLLSKINGVEDND